MGALLWSEMVLLVVVSVVDCCKGNVFVMDGDISNGWVVVGNIDGG